MTRKPMQRFIYALVDTANLFISCWAGGNGGGGGVLAGWTFGLLGDGTLFSLVVVFDSYLAAPFSHRLVTCSRRWR